MIINKKDFDLKNKTYIMGILNMTPDSFSDGGTHNTLEAGIRHAEKMLNDGASIIDVGGESTRPGYEMISVQEEIDRVCPVIERITREFDTAISIDTYKAEVAAAAIKAGAGMVNDVWGLAPYEDVEADERFEISGISYEAFDMADLVMTKNVAYCLMHNSTKVLFRLLRGKQLANAVLEELFTRVDFATEYGIDEEQICIDPGFGFGKTAEGCTDVLRYIEKFSGLAGGLLIGTSRKSFLTKSFAPDMDRDRGTLMSAAYAFARCHVGIVRVHDVKAHKELLDSFVLE